MIQFHTFSGTAQRFVGFILLLPLIAAFWYSAILATIMFVVISVLMFRELGTMAGVRGLPLGILLALGGLINLWPFAAAIYGWSIPTMFVFVIGLALICRIAFVRLTGDHRVADFCLMMVICVASGSFILGLPEGRFLLLALALVIACCDCAAYFVGRAVGGPRLAPAISPNKTISGALGGTMATLLAAVLLFGPMDLLDLEFSISGEMVMLSWFQIIAGGLVIGLLAQIGDLLESAVKRRLGFKDSSQLIPGHGGVLDRFDGYLLTLPAMILFFMLA